MVCERNKAHCSPIRRRFLKIIVAALLLNTAEAGQRITECPCRPGGQTGNHVHSVRKTQVPSRRDGQTRKTDESLNRRYLGCPMPTPNDPPSQPASKKTKPASQQKKTQPLKKAPKKSQQIGAVPTSRGPPVSMLHAVVCVCGKLRLDRRVPGRAPAVRRARSRVQREQKPFVPWPNSSTVRVFEDRRPRR